VLAVDGAAGTFIIGDTTDQLLAASTRSNMVAYDLKVERGSDSTEAWLKLRETGVKWRGPRGQNRAEIRLNDRPSWEIDLDVGAARVDADLTAFAVTKVSIDAGASSIHLKLGTRAERTDVRVDAGASSIRIAVPESVGCEVRLDGALSSKHLDGFQSVGSGKHRTENYESSDKKISIVIDAGVSSIRVSRY